MLSRTLIVTLAVTTAAPLARAERAPVTGGDVPTVAPSAEDLTERWITRPLTFDAVGIVGGSALGPIAAVDVDYAPVPWLYVQGRAGIRRTYGGSLHLRQIFGRSALSFGVGVLHTGARTSEDSEGDWLFPDRVTDYSYNATEWATGEAALEIRANHGVTFKFIAGLDHAVSGGAYTCMSTTYDGLFDGGTTAACGSGRATDAPYVGFAIGFSPKI